MNVYLAGPMRGYPEFNYPAFDAAAKRLRESGYAVFNPADHDRSSGIDLAGTSGSQDDLDAAGFSIRDALGADLAWITATADMLCVLPGWEHSKGACAEVATAHAIGIPVMRVGDAIGDAP